MKYEFVEFYPFVNQKKTNVIGTCHIYAVDCELDIRGILVIQRPNSFLFRMPTQCQFDPEEGKKVNFPVVMFTSDEKQQELWDFLHQQVLPEIKKKMKPISKKKKKPEIDNVARI